MTTKVIDGIFAVVESDELLISDVQSALDFIANVRYSTGCDMVILNKGAVCEDFFRLSSGIAGDILQKFTNYQMKLAIYGDFTRYTSKPLKDFMFESNRGGKILFTATKEEAVTLFR